MQSVKEECLQLWLYDSIDSIDLKVNKALLKAKQSIMKNNRTNLLNKAKINAAGQEAIVADLLAESEFLKSLEGQNLNGVLYSEESGVQRFGSPELKTDTSIILLLDPLDGSQNYLKGLPFGCISVAYGKYIDNPHLGNLTKASILNLYADEIFFAEKGAGAYFNREKISNELSQKQVRQNSIQISYYAYGSKAARYYFDFQEIYHLRSLGSAAWELACVANDRIDAFADIRGVLKAHDFAAAKIILEEVGGKFTFLEINGYETPNDIPINDFTTGYSIIASKNMKLLNKMVEDFKAHDLL